MNRDLVMGATLTPNAYSRRWFELFLDEYPPAQTARDVAFLQRQLPLPPYTKILDLCCGNGRHATAMAEIGYDVTGVDKDEIAIARASSTQVSSVKFVANDIREYLQCGHQFDAVTIMWQSFGFFEPNGNRDLLGQIRDSLRPGGRLILDIYNREFYAKNHQSERNIAVGQISVSETWVLKGNRLEVTLKYDKLGVETDSGLQAI